MGEANLKVDDYRCGKSTVMNTAGFAKCKTFKNLAPKYCQVIFFSAALVLYVKGVLFHLWFFFVVLSFSLSRCYTVSQQLVKCSQLLIIENSRKYATDTCMSDCLRTSI